MPSIFVSYRRTDVPGHAGRIYDRLAQRFGKDNVFMDLDSTAPGADFAEVISDTIQRCDALVAVIGRDWNSAGSPGHGRSRLDDPEDWVRREIATALARNIRVVPVLVEGAHMPSASELPRDLAGLVRRQGVELAETAWGPQLEHLIDSLAAGAPPTGDGRAGSRPRSEWATPSRIRMVALTVTLCAIVIAIAVTVMSVGDGGGSSPGPSTSSGPAGRSALTREEYRLRLAQICVDHEREADQLGRANPDNPVLSAIIPIERRTTDRIAALRPPEALEAEHRSVLALWGRRLSLLTYYYDRLPDNGDDPAFLREFRRQMKRVGDISGALRKRFVALGVTPECDFFRQ